MRYWRIIIPPELSINRIEFQFGLGSAKFLISKFNFIFFKIFVFPELSNKTVFKDDKSLQTKLNLEYH